MGFRFGACLKTAGAGGTLTTSNGEGLTFDFRVKRRVLKITLADFNIPSQAERAQLTFYNGSNQVAQLIQLACNPGSVPANFVVDPGVDFTRVDVQALSRLGVGATSDFSVSSIAACAFGNGAAPCTLPGQDNAYDC